MFQSSKSVLPAIALAAAALAAPAPAQDQIPAPPENGAAAPADPGATPEQATAQARDEAAAPAEPAAVKVEPGSRVLDPAGGEVGTIARLDGDHAILRTDRHEARLPLASFAPRDTHLVMAMTRDEVNAAVEAKMGRSENLGSGAAGSTAQEPDATTPDADAAN